MHVHEHERSRLQELERFSKVLSIGFGFLRLMLGALRAAIGQNF